VTAITKLQVNEDDKALESIVINKKRRSLEKRKWFTERDRLQIGDKGCLREH